MTGAPINTAAPRFGIRSRRTNRTRSRPSLIRRMRAGIHPEMLSFGMLVAMMAMLGGGNASMPIPRFLAELLAAGLLTLTVASSHSALPRRLVAADGLIAAIIAVIALQLVPLPPALWGMLPGRSIALDIDNAVFGGPQWRPLTLDPTATVETAMALLPPLCVYFAVRTGPRERFSAIVNGLLVAGAAGLVLGLLQLLFPALALLQPYPRGDYGSPIGLFTNHNHQATYLVCMIPLAAMRSAAGDAAKRNVMFGRVEWLKLSAAAFVVMLVLASGSRTGSLLLLVGIALTIAAMRQGRLRVAARFAAIAVVVCVIVALGSALLFRHLRCTSPLATSASTTSIMRTTISSRSPSKPVCPVWH